MASGLPSGRMVIVVASFALCCAVDFAPWLSSASGFPPAAHRLPPAGRYPRQQIPPPSAPPGPTQALPAVRDSGRATKGTAVIRGTVYAGDTGTPLRRARVAWSSGIPYSPGGGADTRPVVMTDTNGRYEIRNLPAGRYHVLARRSGYLQMEFAARRGTGATRGAVADADRGIAIELTDGQTFGGADFVLPRAAAIAGRIVDEVGDPVMGALVGVMQIVVTSQVAEISGNVAEDGRPAPHVPVIVFPENPQKWDFQSRSVRLVNTDDTGRFTVSPLPAAEYRVAAAPRVRGGNAWQRPEFLESLMRESTRLVLHDEEHATVDLRLTKTRRPPPR